MKRDGTEFRHLESSRMGILNTLQSCSMGRLQQLCQAFAEAFLSQRYIASLAWQSCFTEWLRLTTLHIWLASRFITSPAH